MLSFVAQKIFMLKKHSNVYEQDFNMMTVDKVKNVDYYYNTV